MKTNLERTILQTIIISFLLILVIIISNILTYRQYNKNYNKKINSIIKTIYEKYPNITKDEISSILNSNKDNFNLEYYGISKTDSISLENNKIFKNEMLLKIIIILFGILLISLININLNLSNRKEIYGIINLLDRINHKDYATIDNCFFEDGEYSSLKSEIYKLGLSLKEQSVNLLNDKVKLKESIEDISHQIRTPLTAILINIDNILDSKDMCEKDRIRFIKEIKKETLCIKNLVDSLLKLSRFNVNAITFNKKKVYLDEIINKSIDNVAALLDLRDIKVNISYYKNSYLYLDPIWEVEAITNILKNAIEHSKIGNNVDINIIDNKAYYQLEIINYDSYIKNEDIDNIFKRFYIEDNLCKERFGIGLPLAKKIIEKDGGIIDVKSNEGTTIFIIKYFK